MLKTALLLIGGAFLFFSCKKNQGADTGNNANVVTLTVENFTMINTREGELSYIVRSPLMEKYGFAKEPYMEFRKGGYVEKYNDSTKQVEVTLSANYAINIESQQLWELKGSVVVINAKGEKLETEQLFWNEKTRRIYSNVDSKLSSGTDVNYGTGFESDDAMEQWEFRNPRWDVDVPESYSIRENPNQPGDSTEKNSVEARQPSGESSGDSPSAPAIPSPAVEEGNDTGLQVDTQR